jgi:hypothetical protein
MPAVALTVVGYTNRANFLVAQISLTNIGTAAVSYGAWGDIPYGWMKAQTTAGWTNDRMAPPFTGSILIVRPRSGAAFSLALPRGTVRWQCGFAVRTASFRERTVERLFELGLLSRADRIPICGRLLDLVLDLLPSRRGPELEFKSSLFELGPPLHNKARAANPAMTSLFHAGCQWRGVADARR